MSGFRLEVRVGELRVALPAEAVRHVARGLPLAPLPGAFGALLGLVEHGGEPLPVLDLGRALGEGGIAGGAPAATVFAWIGAGAERQLVGLAVDEAIAVTAVEVDPETRPDAAEPPAGALRLVDLEALGALR